MVMEKLKKLIGTDTFQSYLLWAVVQHAIVLTVASLLPLSLVGKTIFSALLFGALHFPNNLLMAITLFAGVLIYGCFYSFGIWAMFLVAPAHAALGLMLRKNGTEMRVLHKHPEWKKYFK